MNKSVVLVYRPSSPAAVSLYTTLLLDKLYSRPALEIEVSGFFVDFLSIKTDHYFEIFRVFEQPLLVVKDIWLEFNFTIQSENPKTKIQSEKLQVQSVNYPSGFEPTKKFNSTIKSLKLSSQGNYSWDDREWFKGHVLSYNYTCLECDDKVRIR